MPLSRRRTTIVQRRNKLFVGRDDVLDRLRSILLPETRDREPPICVISGLGGIGKTQTALEYCYRFEDHYDWQFWITAETSTKLLDTFHDISRKIPKGEDNAGDLCSDVLQWMETTNDRWLVVFDNVQQWSEMYDNYFPRFTQSSSGVIVTTQLATIDNTLGFVMPMESMSVQDGAKLLMLTAGYEDSNDKHSEAALEISRSFGGLPLALAHIGGFVKESGESLASYRAIFKERYPFAWKGKTQATERYDKPMEIVWDFALSHDQLTSNGRRLVEILAFLDADGVAERIIIKSCESDESWGFARGSGAAEFASLRRALGKRSLITRAGEEGFEFLAIHRSLQHAILLQLDQNPDLRQERFTQAFRMLRDITPRPSPKQIPDRKQWPDFEIVVAHIVSLCKRSDQVRPPIGRSLEVAELFYGAGFYFWESENPSHEDSVLLLEAAESILELEHESMHGLLRANIHAILAMCCDHIGSEKAEESLERRKKTREIRKQIRDKEIEEQNLTENTDRLLYNSMNDQAISELYLNEFEKAERLFDECFQKYQIWGPEERIPFEYAKYYHNMAFVRTWQGRFDEAISMSKKAVELAQRHDQSRSSRVLWFEYDLASIRLQAGDVKNALMEHTSVLEERERQLGPSSEMTLLSLYTVGATHHHDGNYNEADVCIKECIKRADDVGRGRWNRCAYGRACLHLSVLRKEQGVQEELIQPYEERGRDILEQYRRTEQLRKLFFIEGMQDLDYYDAIHPVFDGRFTGRRLLTLLRQETSLL